ncbi:MAG TPA: ATP-binding protein [Xanthobacteraceae bacterium]|nr:ATP-binding protein [Xanthobacteraceae bacterium]
MLRSIVHLDSVRAYIDALVHPSARTDALTLARHRSFIAVRLLGGLIVLSAIPLYLALRGVPTPLEAFIFAWLVAPLLVVAYLSRTGNFERAHLISAAALAGFITVVAGATGGAASFAAPWLVVLPLEAALSASRRAILSVIALAVAILAGLWTLGMAGVLPAAPPVSTSFYMLGVLSAALYTSALALGFGAFVRHGERIKDVGEARYRMLAQNMTDLITRHARNGSVTFVSHAAERLAGVQPSALVGDGMFERVHVADRPAFLTALADAARGGEAAVEYRLRHGALAAAEDRPAGPVFIWVEMRCRALEGARQMGEVVAVTRDISRSKRDATDLESARSDAERANETKSHFLATVSHELRTPLNAIIGFSEMLENETAMRLDASRRADYARVIRESGQHLLAVVNGILDVSQIEAGQFRLRPEPIAVAAEVEGCYEMMVLRAEQAGVRLDVAIDPNLPTVVADRIALRQILINLISNAVKFTPRGGSVDVAVRAAGADMLILVSDTGIGIAEADLAQVGDPFFQAASSYDRSYEGTGLGLSVVKGLVELHGGSFNIASRLGEGTRVSVRLPREARQAPQMEANIVERLEPRPAMNETEKVKRSA